MQGGRCPECGLPPDGPGRKNWRVQSIAPTLLTTADTCGLGKDGAIASPQSGCVECASLEDRAGALYEAEAVSRLVSSFAIGGHLRSFLAFPPVDT
jgi:hypothetical protein